nr:hypothetical protein Iba_chr08eCG5330 [Ipomoea batatas]GMD52593.1 hypothetical protein Iba_scaffold47292CG0010 [Ipomoea batatas]
MFGFVLMEVFGSYNWGLRTGGGRAWCILSCGVVHYCESLVHYKSPWWIAVLQSVQWVFGVVHCCRVLGGSQYFRVCNGFLVLYIAVEFFASRCCRLGGSLIAKSRVNAHCGSQSRGSLVRLLIFEALVLRGKL